MSKGQPENASGDTSSPDKLRLGFISLCESLLTSVSEVFPECEDTQDALELFRTAVKGDKRREHLFLVHCGELSKANAELINARDPEGIFRLMDGVEQLQGINIREKWQDAEFSEASREHFWQYVIALKTYAELYNSIPQGLLGKIEKIAGSMCHNLQEGKMDLQNLDISEIGRTLMSSISEEDAKAFEGKLPDIYGCMADVMKFMGGSPPGATGFDVNDLMKQMAAVQSKVDTSGGKIDAQALIQQMMGSVTNRDGGRTRGTGASPDLSALMGMVSSAMAPSLSSSSFLSLPSSSPQ